MENVELISKLSEFVPDAEVLFAIKKNGGFIVLDVESMASGAIKKGTGETIPIIQFFLEESDFYEEYSTED